MKFDWHDGNSAKCEKNGLTLSGIEAFFRSEPRVSLDPMQSVDEQRFIAAGPMPDGRPAFVSFCWRSEKIRPVSARYMHKKEARRYENRPHHGH